MSTFSRFAYHRKEVNSTRAHWRLFLPPEDGNLSIFSVDGLSESETTDLGRKKGQKRADKRGEDVYLYGWARLGKKAHAVLMEERLSLKPDNRHHNVVGWPDDELEVRRIAKRVACSCCSLLLACPVRISPAPAQAGP